MPCGPTIFYCAPPALHFYYGATSTAQLGLQSGLRRSEQSPGSFSCVHRACFRRDSRGRRQPVGYPAAKRFRRFLSLFGAPCPFETMEHLAGIAVHVLPDKSRRLAGRTNKAAATAEDANRGVNDKIGHGQTRSGCCDSSEDRRKRQASTIPSSHSTCGSPARVTNGTCLTRCAGARVPLVPPSLTSANVARRHRDDPPREYCWTARASDPAVVPHASMPLGHDVSAMGAHRRMIRAVSSATNPHFIDRPAVGAAVLERLRSDHVT